MLKQIKYLLLIVFLAAILRLMNLSSNPPALNWDEVSHGYNAYSVLKTGSDEWGKLLPTIFQAYGDYKLPVYIYLTTLSQLLLGLTSIAVRLPSALAGITTVIFTYLLVKKLFNKEKLALLSAFLVAIEPWSLFLSRGAFEANLSLALIIAGVYLFTTKNKLLSFLLLGLSLWTYNSARVFVPLLLASLIAIYRINSKKIILPILLFMVFFLPMVYQLFHTVGVARYGKVAILDEGGINKILDIRSKMNLPTPMPRLISNKITYFSAFFVKNYFSHFSPKFLFFKGGTNYQFNIPNRGLIYLINLPFFVLGLIYLIRNYKEKNCQLILFWLILSPIASSLTREAPHTLRSIVMLPMPMIITALGFSLIKEKKWITAGYMFVLTLFLGSYLDVYFNNYRVNYSWSWQYGYREVVSYIKENYEKYDKIIITKKYGEPHEFLLFYLKYDPSKYANDVNLIRFNQSDWYWVDRFDKFYFVNDWEVPKTGNDFVLESGSTVHCSPASPSQGGPSTDHCLLITSPDNSPSGWLNIYRINFLDGKPAFEMYAN